MDKTEATHIIYDMCWVGSNKEFPAKRNGMGWFVFRDTDRNIRSIDVKWFKDIKE